MNATTVNPPPTPARGLVQFVPAGPRYTVTPTQDASPAVPGITSELEPEWEPYDPKLTPGQLRVLDADRDRLFRLLDRAPRDRPGSRDLFAVLVLLEDLATQAPAVDAAIREEAVRRSLTGGVDRPRPAQLLTKRGRP